MTSPVIRQIVALFSDVHDNLLEVDTNKYLYV